MRCPGMAASVTLVLCLLAAPAAPGEEASTPEAAHASTANGSVVPLGADRIEVTPLEKAAAERVRSDHQEYLEKMVPVEERTQGSRDLLAGRIIGHGPPERIPPGLESPYNIVGPGRERIWPSVLFDAELVSLAKLEQGQVSGSPFLEIVIYTQFSPVSAGLFLKFVETDCDDVGLLIDEWDLRTGQRLQERYPALVNNDYWGDPEVLTALPVRRHIPLYVVPRKDGATRKDGDAWDRYLRGVAAGEIPVTTQHDEPTHLPPTYMSPPSPDRVIVVRMYDAEGHVSNGVQPIWLDSMQDAPAPKKVEVDSSSVPDSDVAPGLAESAWPMFRGDLRHTGRSPNVGPRRPTVRWKVKMAESLWGFDSSPAIGPDGTVYVGSEDNHLYALSPSGEVKWKAETGGAIGSSVAVGADGTAYVGSYDRHLYAVGPSGQIPWKIRVRGRIKSSPAIGTDGTVYVASGGGYLYAVSPSGEVRWKAKMEGIVYSSPAVGTDGTVYVGSEDGYLYAISPSGEVKWRVKTGDMVRSSPAIDAEGTVYVGSQDNYLYAINPSGEIRWKVRTEGNVDSSPAIGADGTVYVGSGDGHLYAIGEE